MKIKIIGPAPGTLDPATGHFPKVGSLIVDHGFLITTSPAVHACQRNDFIDRLNEQRLSDGRRPLSTEEERTVHDNSVSLFFGNGTVLIRPALESFELALKADQLLQSLIPKHRIRFLHARQSVVRDALRARGELWRVSEPPRTVPEMEEFIRRSLVAIGGKAIYRINSTTGTRWLTLQQLRDLGHSSPAELAFHLEEIRRFGAASNRSGQPELRWFALGDGKPEWPPTGDMAALAPAEIQNLHRTLLELTTANISPEFRRDDLKNAVWRDEMFKVLTEDPEGPSLCDVVDGLGEAFRRQVLWLPGGGFEEGELLMDPIFEQAEGPAPDEAVHELCDPSVKEFIPNFLREFGEIEYVNVGRVLTLQASRPSGRRSVYLAEIKSRQSEQRVLRILRMHRWGICEHLLDGEDLLNAILKAHEYSHYVLDRRLACRQLGMNVPLRVSCWDIPEQYRNPDGSLTKIWASYYERDYLPGTAANRISQEKLASDQYALSLARLLGQAAAPNLIVGRADENTTQGVFDVGDELVIEDDQGLPREIVVCDHSRSFGNFRDPLAKLVGAYVQPVRSRLHLVPLPALFSEAYVQSFGARLSEIRKEYLGRENAFRHLFENQPIDEAGSFRYRWLRVLDRLEASDPQQIAELVRQQIP